MSGRLTFICVLEANFALSCVPNARRWPLRLFIPKWTARWSAFSAKPTLRGERRSPWACIRFSCSRHTSRKDPITCSRLHNYRRGSFNPALLHPRSLRTGVQHRADGRLRLYRRPNQSPKPTENAIAVLRSFTASQLLPSGAAIRVYRRC
jgi:hypothetical protein